MNGVLSKRRRPTGNVLLAAGFALLTLPFSGCGAPPGPPGAMPGTTPPGMAARPTPPVQSAPVTRTIATGAAPALPPSPVESGAALPAQTPAPPSLPLADKPPLPGNPSENAVPPEPQAEKPSLTLPETPKPASAVNPGNNADSLTQVGNKTEPGKAPPEKALPGMPARRKTPMVSMDTLEDGGQTVRLASAILTAGANPFLNRLPKPLVEPSGPTVEAVAPSVAPPPPADPFESVNLVGILYNAKKPMALVASSSGETPGGAESGGNQNQIVGVGSVLPASGGTLRVIGIQRDRVEFQRVDGNNRERRTLSLPGIVGFEPRGNSERTAQNAASPAAAATPSATPAGTGTVGRGQSTAPAASPSPNLGNLTRLMEAGPPSSQPPGP